MGHKKKFVTLTVLLLGLGILFWGSHPAEAQSGVVFSHVKVGHKFGDYIRFRVQVESSDPIAQVTIFFRDKREENTRTEIMTQTDGEFIYRYDASDNYLHPFAKLTMKFQVQLENGQIFESQSYGYTYSDNRFLWQMRAEDNFRVYWSEGDESFGQAALDAARNGLTKIETFFPADLNEPVDIYIYAAPADLQNALFLGGESWVAGHADPALGTVFVSIAPSPEQRIAMQQQIPHELSHVLLYRYLGEDYNHLPTWLLEGVATLSQLYPNPDYALALERGGADNTLIPVAALCAGFPRDASQAFLAYAEAVSFTQYLRETYGMDAFGQLLQNYANGYSCEAGAEETYQQALNTLDARWQEDVLGVNRFGTALREIAPYLLMMAIFLAYPTLQFFITKPKRAANEPKS